MKADRRVVLVASDGRNWRHDCEFRCHGNLYLRDCVDCSNGYSREAVLTMNGAKGMCVSIVLICQRVWNFRPWVLRDQEGICRHGLLYLFRLANHQSCYTAWKLNDWMIWDISQSRNQKVENVWCFDSDSVLTAIWFHMVDHISYDFRMIVCFQHFHFVEKKSKIWDSIGFLRVLYVSLMFLCFRLVSWMDGFDWQVWTSTARGLPPWRRLIPRCTGLMWYHSGTIYVFFSV